MLLGLLSYELLATAATIVLLYFYLFFSRKWHWFDPPTEARKLHNRPKPTSAGLVFMLPLVLMLFLLPAFSYPFKYTVALCLLSIIIIGGIDDFRHISAKFRLLFLFVVSLIVILSFFSSATTAIFWLVIYLIGMVWWINLYNFMDGADGMAILHGIITAIGYLLAYYLFGNGVLMLLPYVFLFILLMLAFLLFNFPHAKMFMGDSGSLSIGFMLAVFALYGIKTQSFDVILVLSFHLLFIIDASLTLFLRLKFKHKITQAHALHLYQCHIKDGFQHWQISLIYAIITAFLVVLALLFSYLSLSLPLRGLILLCESAVLSYLWFNFHKKKQFAAFIL